jgi:hypothetical protein
LTDSRICYRHFADEKVDIGVIETGLGGLTDATNVIDEKQLQLAVISSLGRKNSSFSSWVKGLGTLVLVMFLMLLQAKIHCLIKC